MTRGCPQVVFLLPTKIVTRRVRAYLVVTALCREIKVQVTHHRCLVSSSFSELPHLATLFLSL